MPDADDFDVEYFRSLLAGKGGEKEQEKPAKEPARAPARQKPPKAAKRPSAGKRTPAKRGKRT